MRTRDFKIIFLCLFALIESVQAQQVDDQKEEINRIKKSSLYLYGETTMPDKEEAMATAVEILQNEAQRWVQEKKKRNEIASNLIMNNIERISSKTELPRGNMYRAFVYVKKSDILTSQNTVISKLEASPDTELKSSYEVVENQTTIIHPEAIQRLLALKKSEEILPCLSALKAEGKIIEYNQYSALDRVEDYVLIIHNRQGQVEAVLSEGEKRVNLRTNAPDGVVNYKGRGAMGVKLNK